MTIATLGLDGTYVYRTATLRERYPKHVIVSTTSNINLFAFPEVRVNPLPGVEPPVTHVVYRAPARRGDGPGGIAQDIRFGYFALEWKNDSYIMLTAEWREEYLTLNYTAVLKAGGQATEAAIHGLFIAASAYARAIREEILVFQQGYWQKDHGLWIEVQKADWADVILDEEFKEKLQNDVDNFFKSEEIYKELSVPWKRGIILLGPPGNGKTISTKAIMKAAGEADIPSLYVKSFQSWKGEEGGIRDVFIEARKYSPCIVIFEDIDSLVNDTNRSFFLNELDGLESNDGLLVIGTTNHFERLDPGLSNRPSRFDRKFVFDNPSMSERIMYCHYWKKKLAANKKISFPKTLVEHIAEITADFSFAYLKEAFVSSLIALAGGTETGEFSDVIEKQIKALRKELRRGGGDNDVYSPKVVESLASCF